MVPGYGGEKNLPIMLKATVKTESWALAHSGISNSTGATFFGPQSRPCQNKQCYCGEQVYWLDHFKVNIGLSGEVWLTKEAADHNVVATTSTEVVKSKTIRKVARVESRHGFSNEQVAHGTSKRKTFMIVEYKDSRPRLPCGECHRQGEKDVRALWCRCFRSTPTWQCLRVMHYGRGQEGMQLGCPTGLQWTEAAQPTGLLWASLREEVQQSMVSGLTQMQARRRATVVESGEHVFHEVKPAVWMVMVCGQTGYLGAVPLKSKVQITLMARETMTFCQNLGHDEVGYYGDNEPTAWAILPVLLNSRHALGLRMRSERPCLHTDGGHDASDGCKREFQSWPLVMGSQACLLDFEQVPGH